MESAVRLTGKALFAAMSFLAVLSLNANPKANWPSWRGDGSGVFDGEAHASNVCLTNVLWEVKIRGLGYSSPIVFGDYAFVTTAIKTHLTEFPWLAIGAISAICATVLLWWQRRPHKHARDDRITVFWLIVFVCALAGFEGLQRIHELSNFWLAGSYPIRIWLASAFVSLAGLVAAAHFSKRRAQPFIIVTLTICLFLVWFAWMVPDRHEQSRQVYRWLYWLLTLLGIPLALPAVNFGPSNFFSVNSFFI